MVNAGVYFDSAATSGLVSWEYKKSITSVTDQCSIILENVGGVGITQVSHFQDVKIYAATDVLVWRGLVYDINIVKDGTLEIICFGYMRSLMTQFHTGTYTAKTIGYIIENLVDTYGAGIGITTTGNITATTGTITRTLKGVSVFDTILDLANEINYDIWVGINNDFYAVERGKTASGSNLTLTGGSVAQVDVPTEGRQIYNRVVVHGDANQDGICETVVMVEDRASQSTYGIVKEYPPIVDIALRTEAECEARGMQIMDAYSTPVGIMTVEVFGYNSVDPGETITVSGFSTLYGASDGNYLVMERAGSSIKGSQILTLAEYTSATQDTIADLIRKSRKSEYSKIDAAATVTRCFNFYEEAKADTATKIWVDNNSSGFVWGRVPGMGFGRADGITWGRTGIVTTLYSYTG